jgi:beta-glucosidase
MRKEMEICKQYPLSRLKAGIDMDMVGEGFLTTLKKSFERRKGHSKTNDDASRRILEAKYKLGLFSDAFLYTDESRGSARDHDHRYEERCERNRHTLPFVSA